MSSQYLVRRGPPVRGKTEIALTIVALLSTVTAAILLQFDLSAAALQLAKTDRLRALVEMPIFIGCVWLLIYGNLIYQLARFGHYWRQLKHHPATAAEIETIYDRADPSALLILVPSYKEDPHVVWQSLLSAGLVEHPNRRVVLLIDDPPNPTGDLDRLGLEAMRRLPNRLSDLLAGAAAQFSAEFDHFKKRRLQRSLDAAGEAAAIARLYEDAAAWFEDCASVFTEGKGAVPLDHAERLFLDRVLIEPARRHRETALDIRQQTLSGHRIEREYRRLATLFRVEFASFERKGYANLSHASNKAMNINSYLALIGKCFREEGREDGVYLEACKPADAALSFPDAEYVITLDADSLLLSDYALRLIHVMEQPGNERVAVAQTPYSSAPGAQSLLERVAGATTDVQHIIHQGFTLFNATYWVGANALLRRTALEDIAVDAKERGHPVRIYIQDATVIEDTGSTVDLIRRGWRLYNYPARLAFSATPADFGAFLIQRRRWANGGLLIVPSLARYVAGAIRHPSRLLEGFVRLHYLISPAIVGFCLLTLLVVPFEDRLTSLWLPLTALPYYLLYGRDLTRIGYRWVDLPRVYALNMLLVAINLGGVAQSLRQAWSGVKTPFNRTPKISGRTAAPATYHGAEYGILLYCFQAGLWDTINGFFSHAVYSILNAIFLLYGIGKFIGFGATREDLRAQCYSRAVDSIMNANFLFYGVGEFVGFCATKEGLRAKFAGTRLRPAIAARSVTYPRLPLDRQAVQNLFRPAPAPKPAFGRVSYARDRLARIAPDREQNRTVVTRWLVVRQWGQ